MNHNKKWQFIVILILSGILLFEMIFYLQKNYTIPTFSPTFKAERKDDLIIRLFLNSIIADSSKFYDNYFSEKLEYFDYEFKIKDIKNKSGDIYITLETTPMIGAHNPVGDDEITYKVDVFGNKTLENFTHKKSYEIPSFLQNTMIKPYPETKN